MALEEGASCSSSLLSPSSARRRVDALPSTSRSHSRRSSRADRHGRVRRPHRPGPSVQVGPVPGRARPARVPPFRPVRPRGQGACRGGECAAARAVQEARPARLERAPVVLAETASVTSSSSLELVYPCTVFCSITRSAPSCLSSSTESIESESRTALRFLKASLCLGGSTSHERHFSLSPSSFARARRQGASTSNAEQKSRRRRERLAKSDPRWMAS